MLRQIGDIVIRARTREGVTVDKLAQQAGVDPAVLRALERGEAGISTAALDRVAQQLQLDGASLLVGEEVPHPRASIFLRHSGTQDFNHDAEEALDRALEAGRHLRFLNDRLGVEPSVRRSPEIRVREAGPQAASDGYELARRVRRLLKAPSAPIGDLGELLEERFEVVVLVAALGTPAMTAVSVRDTSGAAAVVLNSMDPKRRENLQLARTHLAHELCHLLYDPSDGGLHLVIDRLDDDDSRGQNVERAEQRARAFAAEFLLPLSGLVDLLRTPAYTESETVGRELVAKARKHFCTPWEIAVNHLNHQGYLSDDVRLALLRQGPRGASPGSIETRLPPDGSPSFVMRERVKRANEELIISDGQARVALGLSISEALPWE